MKKVILLILLLSSFLSASVIHNVSLLDTKNKCIYNDYYNKGGYFYYRYLTSPKILRKTSSKKYTSFIINSYKYDTNTSICSPEAWRVMGMSSEDFNFLNALIGLFFGVFMLGFVSYLFITVGGKK
jgi:hypothetical protein